jgi:tetratricopeptide (TPR) repeat protein
MEIPYQPYYAFEEILAAFGDAPGLPSTLLSAFERLTAELTEGKVTALGPQGSEVRVQYIEAFRRWLPDSPSLAGDILVSYAAEDAAWAGWIAHVLSRAGHRVTTADVSTKPGLRSEAQPEIRTVVVLSSAYVRSPEARALWESVTRYDPRGEGRRLIPIAISELSAPEPFNNRTEANIARVSEAEAAALVLEALGGATGRETASDSAGPRFPGTRPEVWNLRIRNSVFTGRGDVFQRLREQFDRVKLATVPQVLLGLGGVGKTQVALEYAYRFIADYDLVWWIDAEQPDRVAVSLAELAARLGLRVSENVADAAVAARDALQHGQLAGRWLLIFDNADDPDEIAGYFPPGTGHILVTSRNQAWSSLAEPLEVDVFSREESVEHLRRQVKSLGREGADEVAEAVGDLPLAIGIAAAWLDTTGTPVEDYVAQLTVAAREALSVPVNADHPGVFGRAWEISLRRLRGQCPSAGRLLEIAAYFSADQIPRELLFSNRMVRELEPAEPEVHGPQVLRLAIESIGRYGLAKVDLAGGTIQVHPMVQALLRSSLAPEVQAATMHVVHAILVEARPVVYDVGGPENWPAFERIWPHLTPSGAVDCDDGNTRDLLLDRVRYLWMREELKAAEALARQLEQVWLRRLGADHRQTLLLRSQIANVLRSQGRYQESRSIDYATLATQRELLGPDDPHSLITARNLAADLRALGRFQEALELDQDVVDKMRGDKDDPQMLFTVNNLAIDYRCTGDYMRARDLDQETLDRKLARLGPDHSFTLTSKAALAEDLRALGDYQGSLTQLEEFREKYVSVPVTNRPSLRYASSLAVTLRQIGREVEARNINSTTYDQLRKNHGEHVPDTLACALNLAADHSATGENERARDFAVEVRDGCRDHFGADHPFTLACEVNITIYLRDSGRVVEAVDLGERTVATLDRLLGPSHPYTLTARLNLVNSYGAAGESLRSAELGQAVLAGISARYGASHPDAVICEANLAVALRESGQEADAERSHAHAMQELLAQLGPRHPAARACRLWQRLGRPLEILPL